MIASGGDNKENQKNRMSKTKKVELPFRNFKSVGRRKKSVNCGYAHRGKHKKNCVGGKTMR